MPVWSFAQLYEPDPSTIEIYVTPYYNSKGPVINIGKFSRGLASDEEGVFLETIGKMKEQWKNLTAEELYVGAIVLYDREYRDEAVYWFYSAQMRSRVFNGILDQSKLGGLGSAGFELMHAQNSFFQLVGPFINGYAFGDLDKLQHTLERVRKEEKDFPDLAAIYKMVSFIPQAERSAIIEQVFSGLSDFIEFIDNERESIINQRIETGAEDKFGNLKNRDLVSQPQ